MGANNLAGMPAPTKLERKPCMNCVANCMACQYEESECGPVYDDHLCLDCRSGSLWDPHETPSDILEDCTCYQDLGMTIDGGYEGTPDPKCVVHAKKSDCDHAACQGFPACWSPKEE